MTPPEALASSPRLLAICTLALLLLQSPVAGQLTPAPPVRQASPAAPAGLAPLTPLVSSPHLDALPLVIRAAGGGGGSPATRVTVGVEVTPKPGVKVYAPGNKAYTGVALRIETPPGLTVGATSQPEAERFLFVPLSEQVLVYSKRFRLMREVKGRAGEVPEQLRGTLEYQACDDKVCYRPQTLPLTWRIDRVGIDRGDRSSDKR